MIGAAEYIAATGLPSPQIGVPPPHNPEQMSPPRKPLPSDYSGGRKAERFEIDWSDPRFSSKEPTFAELYEALHNAECPVCWLAARTVSRYLRTYCEENITDVDVRQTLRDANGYCNRHAHQLLEEMDTLAVSITYADILKKLQQELQAADPDYARSIVPSQLRRLWYERRGHREAPVFSIPEPCPACREQDRSEARYVSALTTFLNDPLLNEKYRAGNGLCLVHLRLALGAALDPETVSVLVAVNLKAWENIQVHLAEVIRKADHLANDERLTEDERKALFDVVDRVVGRPKIR